MHLQDNFKISQLNKKIVFVSVSLFILLLLAYGNSFDASWHFDDYPNIVANPNLHITDLSLDSIVQGFYGKNGSSLSRPVAMLSFALNYYFDEYNVWGYHLVNFAIHYINTIGLFLFIYCTLNLPTQRERYGKTAYPVALIATIFWATNPVQVSAVTYIVQRMTSLAALGYIYSMLFYLLARRPEAQRKQLYYSISGGMALLAFAAKENSFMLPISILLFDLFLISGINRQRTLKILLFMALAGLAIIATSTVYTNPLSILDGYANRPFSLGERLLTEPRIILFYLSLLFYPTPDRLTLFHDIALSTSLFTPITTFISILGLAIIICFALISAKKRPLISYCIIFFFINHLIEGSVIPLELIYEHRNYLPSMLIFLPMAILCVKTINYFSYSRPLHSSFSIGLVIVIISQCNTTTMRNRVFQNEISLWQDCVEKAPQMQRTLLNLGTAYSKNGQIIKAIEYYEKAKAAPHIPNQLPIKRHQLINTNIGTAYYDLGDIKRAKEYYTLNSNDSSQPSPRNLALMALVLLSENKLTEAEELILKAIEQHPSDAPLSVILSKILFRKGAIVPAINKAQYALKIDKKNDQALLIIGLAMRSQGEYENAIRYFRRYLQRRPFDIYVHLALIEVCQASENISLRDKYVSQIVGLTSPNILAKFLTTFCAHFGSKYYSPRENIKLALTDVLKKYKQYLSL